MPSTCDSGSILGCAISSFPWIIAVLLAVVALLVVIRLAMALRARWSRPTAGPAPAPRAPRNVTPGSPLQGPAAGRDGPPQQPRQDGKPTPLQLRLEDRPGLKATLFASAEALDDFAELLTDVILTNEGWKKLESWTGGPNGIDGLFVREVRNGGGFEALAVKTNVNDAAYDPATMSDARLEAGLGALYANGAFGGSNEAVARELVRGLRNGPPFFRKELWRHTLSNGMTSITQLGSKGEQKAGTLRSHARVIAGAYAALKRIDRQGVYVAVQSAVRKADD